MYYKNFKTVTYCVAGWVNHITEEQLRKDADFLQKYVKYNKNSEVATAPANWEATAKIRLIYIPQKLSRFLGLADNPPKSLIPSLRKGYILIEQQ